MADAARGSEPVGECDDRPPALGLGGHGRVRLAAHRGAGSRRWASSASAPGITPPSQCLAPDLDIPECEDAAATPSLVVTKRMHARARVGDRVPITITVENLGQTTRAVSLHETSSRGGRIVRVSHRGSIRSDGTAVWRLGILAPAAKRTVRATMLVRRAGLQVDTAVAEAGNAAPAFDVAVVRARAAPHRPPAHRPPPPAVTG
ncbi:MAG TPA: hypothetical protein VGM91_23910 [Conexibacter sp.]